VGLAAIACILPNLLFALRLAMVNHRGGASYAVNFFVGEFLKIGATIGLLAIAVKGYPEMHWPSLLIGFAIVLHAGFIAFWKKP
jgi:ATP synthase protein I